MATTPQLERTDAESSSPRRKHTREEMLEIFRAFRAEVQAHNPENRDLAAELSAERRAEAERA
ncbi:MAG: hypothetical protein V4555_00050 [Acidobacteriota bacterium]